MTYTTAAPTDSKAPNRKRLDTGGKLLTWLSGMALGLTVLPVVLIGLIAFVIAADGAQSNGPGLMECRDQGCVTETWLIFLGSAAYVMSVITLLVLVVRPTLTSLSTASTLSFLVSAVLLAVAVVLGERDAGSIAGAMLLVSPLLLLGLGSEMRRRARAAR